MNTVNVLEMTGETNILSLNSWEDTPEGNKEAEAHFLECMNENATTPEEVAPASEDCIEEGLYECGDYRLFLIHSTGTQMGNKKAVKGKKSPKGKKLPTECAGVPPVIHGVCHSDDGVVEVQFDASSWFNQASEKEILDLARCGWKNDYPADQVVFYMSDRDQRIADMMKYLELIKNDPMKKDLGGFACAIDETESLVWLKQHRRTLYNRVRKELIR
jgi:hypothetical protein